jgi:phenylalanyl-tRNA synthetase alpha chain
MIDELERITTSGSHQIASAGTLAELQAAEADLLGKRSALTSLKATLGSLDPEQRRTAGAALNQARTELEEAIAARRRDLETVARRARLDAERLDLTEVVDGPQLGHLHLVTQAHDELEDTFVGMGFTIAEGPEIETEWYNFGALNFPPGHPARAMYDTLYVEFGAPESTLLRTHTSPVQMRVMEQSEPPIYVVCPGRVFRSDTPDASHMPVFHQIEGLVVDRGISMADLAGTLDEFTTAYFGGAIHSRLRPSYFPFTEPSAEYDITCVICQGEGCKTCQRTGWIELGGCGMVHPNVLRNGGIDPEVYTGFAFGFGTDRLSLMRYGISDLRDMFSNDIRFLRQF